jgi:molecular chaperone HscB
MEPDYFQLFGIVPKLALNLFDLEQRFYALSRKLHPDRFSRAAGAGPAKAEEASATLNDAYRTLRNPLSRAEYVLARQGLRAAGSGQVPPELLQEVFELNEALDELRGGNPFKQPEVEAAYTRFLGELAAADARLGELFREYDEGAPGSAAEMRAVLNRRRYISNLLTEVNRVLVPLAHA